MEPVSANGSREQATKISRRRVCDLVGVDPKTVRRERPPDHADIRKKMQEIAGTRRRFGYRRIGVMVERDGFAMNEKKLYRLYNEEGLSVRRRRGRKRARGTKAPMPIPNHPNVRWALDPRHGHSDQWRIHGSISDTFGASRKIRVLAVNDDCTRENLGLIADTSLSGARGTGTDRDDPALRQTRQHRQRQWHRVHQHRDPQMPLRRLKSIACRVTGGRYRRRLALHRPRLPQQNSRPLSRTSGVRGLDDRKLQRQPAPLSAMQASLAGQRTNA